LNAVRKIFFDVETSGLSPANGDRVIEIGAVAVTDGLGGCRLAAERTGDVGFFSSFPAGAGAGAGLPRSCATVTPGVEILALSCIFRSANVTFPSF